MGIKSTYEISRATALKILTEHIGRVSDENLAKMLEEFEVSHFRNYYISETSYKGDEKHHIRTVEEFFDGSY